MRNAKRDNVVRLPQAFEPVDFPGKPLDHFRDMGKYVPAMLKILDSTPAEVRRLVAKWKEKQGPAAASDAIDQFDRRLDYVTRSRSFSPSRPRGSRW
jgi:hypothetical protein